MLRKRMTGLSFLLIMILVSCQSQQEEIPVIYEGLSIEALKGQTTLPVELPTSLPFEPIDTVASLDDYMELYDDERRIEEITVRYIKTHKEGRYLDVIVSNFDRIEESGETVTLADGTQAIFIEDEIGQMLFWHNDELNYRLVYYTSTKVNEGQEPLSIEELVDIANSFEPL